MKRTHIKKLLFMIIVAALIFTLAVPVALCEPEDDTATTDEPETTDVPDDSTFAPIMLNDKSNVVIRVQQRLRDLGYITYRATGQYFTMTETGVREFQEQNGLDVDGRVGENTYEKMFMPTGLIRKPLSAAEATKNNVGPGLVGEPEAYGEIGDWSEVIDAAFAVDDTVTITDFNSGVSFKMTRTGGVGHADVEPPNAEEYDAYISCYGGGTNWEKRAVIVTIGGTDYAASLFGNALGEDTISKNTMAGHTCLFFSGSVSDVLGFADKEHDEMVLMAAGKP